MRSAVGKDHVVAVDEPEEVAPRDLDRRVARPRHAPVRDTQEAQTVVRDVGEEPFDGRVGAVVDDDELDRTAPLRQRTFHCLEEPGRVGVPCGHHEAHEPRAPATWCVRFARHRGI